MFSKKCILQILCIFAYCLTCLLSLKHISRTYEVLSLTANSSDENLVKLGFKFRRVGRGVYSITGEIILNYDIYPYDDTMIELSIFRSATGTSDWKPSPFSLKKQHFIHYIDTYYKSTMMETFKDCSNFPYFKDKFIPPFKKGSYKFNACKLTNAEMPSYFTDGFYKIIHIVTGQVNLYIEAISKVQQNEF